MNPTEKTVTLDLDGERYVLHFNFNTYSAFERASGKFFMDFLIGVRSSILDLLPPDSDVKGKAAESVSASQFAELVTKSIDPLAFLRRVSMNDVLAFIWAAAHTYEGVDGEKAVWRYSQAQIGRKFDFTSLPKVIAAITRGSAENSPEPRAVPENGQRPTQAEPLTRKSGGSASGASVEDALSSLTMAQES